MRMTRRTFLRTSGASALVLGAAGQPVWAQKKQVVTIAFPEAITRRPSWGTPEKGALTTHLSYVGNATVGEAANLRAGTITCNYDGVRKHQTVIGARAFVGTNSSWHGRC